LNEEMRRKSLGTSPNSVILVSEYRGRNNSRAPERYQSRSNSKGKYKDVECNYCHKKGHIKKYCWKLKNRSEKDSSDKGSKDSSDDDDRINATAVDFLLVHEFESANLVDSSTSWVIDSGASFHTTYKRDLVTSYTFGDFSCVKMAHGGVARCIGVGQVCLEMSNGSRLVLKHVPDVPLNLLSVGKLCDENYNSSFASDSWKLTKGSMVVGRGTKHSTLYITQVKIVKDVVHAAEFVDGTDLWHKRLCHMSEKGKSILVRNNVLSDVGKTHLQKSSHCFGGKQTRVSFKSHHLQGSQREVIWFILMRTVLI